MTSGLLRPLLLLCRQARLWEVERRRVVLLHELAHVRRADWLTLVLAEIAQLSPQPRTRDLDLITEGLEEGGVLSRLRTAVPSGASSTQGAL